MPDLKTTLGEIAKRKPCASVWEKLCKGLGTDDYKTNVSLSQILNINGVKDAFWALRLWDLKTIAPLRADVAESVLHFYPVKYPDDTRVTGYLKTLRDYGDGKVSKSVLDAAYFAAAAAAADAADAAAAAYFAARRKQWGNNKKLLQEFIKS